MGYNKVIIYGDNVELYEYENTIQYNGRRSQKTKSNNRDEHLETLLNDRTGDSEQEVKRRQDNATRCTMAFRRLVGANLGKSHNPLFVSFTYAENVTEIGQGYKDFKAFARRLNNKFKNETTRYICVPEFQKSGRLHFHALIWGLQTQELAKTERLTRIFQKLWGKGFVDLVPTDGNIKLAGYLAKYMKKSFTDYRLKNKKAYRTSTNIKRPEIRKNELLLPYYHDVEGYPNLSTMTILQKKEFMTQWLGKGKYTFYTDNN